jgi:BirA family biotin operon repressor/biotin-[acetyl-CoA-carboxylase] ligase
VWKHIRKLQEAGYLIEATSRGYRLLDEPDLPYDWEFSGGDTRIHYLPEAPSTMDVALEMARRGAPHLTVVVAGRQTSGRGRLNRRWVSSDGGLYLTLILRPNLHPLYASRMTFLAGLVLARTLQRDFALPAKVKWPNDLLIDERKVAGMLSQMEAEGDTLAFVNIGIGLNVNKTPPRPPPRPPPWRSSWGVRSPARRFWAPSSPASSPVSASPWTTPLSPTGKPIRSPSAAGWRSSPRVRPFGGWPRMWTPWAA